MLEVDTLLSTQNFKTQIISTLTKPIKMAPNTCHTVEHEVELTTPEEIETFKDDKAEGTKKKKCQMGW